MSETYISDISREVFAEIEPILLSGRKRTRPRKIHLYEVFFALRYLLKSGCQWDMSPSGASWRCRVRRWLSPQIGRAKTLQWLCSVICPDQSMHSTPQSCRTPAMR